MTTQVNFHSAERAEVWPLGDSRNHALQIYSDNGSLSIYLPPHVAAHTAAAFNRAMQAVPNTAGGWTYQGKSGVWKISDEGKPFGFLAQHDEITGDNDPSWMFAEACTLLGCMDEIDRVEDEHTCTECNSLVGEDTHDMGDGKRWLCGNCLEREIENERGLREMAEDDKAHAMMERAAGL